MSRASGYSLLAWDSDFFARRIARIDAHFFGPTTAEQIVREARADLVECLYLLLDGDDCEKIEVANEMKFLHVDTRITRERPLAKVQKGLIWPDDIDLCKPDDVENLSAIARESHHDSRFYHDPFFPRDRCDDLYEIWIRNACGGDAEAVVIARKENIPVGYVTCEIPEPGLGRLGLVAVAADQNGLGYGGRMIDGALSWLTSHGCSRVQVVTQGRNTRANRLYESRDFRTLSSQNSYHLWLSSGDHE
ncbi:MAG: GNAT family N-acetyltransferase [Myxococcota bacterium]|nr:GNAT family N-acetyltransferase [Myxococcota bacterium]